VHDEEHGESGRWSVAGVIEHLAIVESRIGKLMTREIDAARAKGLGNEQETSSVVGTLDPRLLADRRRRVTASDASQPREGLNAEAAWLRLEEARRALRDLLLSVDGLALSEITAPHPVLGNLNAYQWFLFVAGHEGRHALQVREIAELLTRT
jgi:hypothetical protein